MSFNFPTIKRLYSRKAPSGFRDYTAKRGVPNPNTCGVRLSYAIFMSDKEFFQGKQAKSNTEWYGLPTRADDVAAILSEHVKKPIKIKSKDDILSKEGIIFFDFNQTKDDPTSGHISLWYNDKVADGMDGLFTSSPRLYFFDFTNSE